MTKMAKIDTLFKTKIAEKPYPLGPHITIYDLSYIHLHHSHSTGILRTHEVTSSQMA